MNVELQNLIAVAGLYKTECVATQGVFSGGNSLRFGLAYFIPVPMTTGGYEIAVFACRLAEGNSTHVSSAVDTHKYWNARGSLTENGKDLILNYFAEDEKGTVTHDEFRATREQFSTLLPGRFEISGKSGKCSGTAVYTKLQNDEMVQNYLAEFDLLWENIDLKVGASEAVSFGSYLLSNSELPQSSRNKGQDILAVDLLSGKIFLSNEDSLYLDVEKNCEIYASVVFTDRLPIS